MQSFFEHFLLFNSIFFFLLNNVNYRFQKYFDSLKSTCTIFCYWILSFFYWTTQIIDFKNISTRWNRRRYNIWLIAIKYIWITRRQARCNLFSNIFCYLILFFFFLLNNANYRFQKYFDSLKSTYIIFLLLNSVFFFIK